MYNLPNTFQFRILGKYPHMQPADVLLWERFIRLNDPQPWNVAYDVRVGSLPDLPDDLPEYLRRDAEALYPLKIDAVITQPGSTLICELKPRASGAAIGQVLSYRLLFRRKYPRAPNPIPVIITDTAHVDTPWLCPQLGITLVELDHMEQPV